MSNDQQQIRLQKFLARCGVASRRNSEKLILDGRISVNGTPVTTLGVKVDPHTDTICLDGDKLTLPLEHHTFKLYKPTGYLTSMGDPFGRACVDELIPREEYPSLFPIGRLDLDTSGLLLFTTDGELGQRLAHPSKQIDKTYIATVAGQPHEHSLDQLRAGITLDDGPCAPAQCCCIEHHSDSTRISITIHEGRNRQVRRMFAAIGHEVLELKRISVGPLSLEGLQLGECVELQDGEYRALMQAIGTSDVH